MASSSSTPSSSRSTIGKTEHDGTSALPPAQAATIAATTVVRGRDAPTFVKKNVNRTPTPSPPPPVTYRDIPLLSTNSDTLWVHHLARFVHHQRMDPTDSTSFVPPLKLNRKHPPKVKQPNPKPGDPVVDRHGRPIKLPGGEPLLWPRVGEDLTEHHRLLDRMKPQEKAASSQYDASLVAPSFVSASRSGSRPLFQKRVRQIHKASATSRRIHNDESLPWILEDFETSHGWESSRIPRKDSLAALAKHFEEGGTGLVDEGADETFVKAEQVNGEEIAKQKKQAAHNHENKIIQHAPWVGKLEGSDQFLSSPETSSAQVLFVFDERNQGGFRVVPVRKTYRFMQRTRFANEMGDEEREKEFARQQRSRDVTSDKFASRKSVSRGPSESSSNWPAASSGRDSNGTLRSGLAMPGSFDCSLAEGVKREEGYDDDWASMRGLSLSNTSSSRPRGLVSVSGGSSSRRGGGADYDEDGAFHRRDDDEGATYDELDYQEDFADDEERMGGEAELVEDAEAREMEDRLKREMAKAGVGADDDETGGGDGPDDSDLFGDETLRRGRVREDDQLTGTGRQMKKIMKALARREGGLEEYESDDDINPYASEDEDEEEPAIANPEEAIRRAREEKEREEKETAKLAGILPGTPSSSGLGTGASQKPPTNSERTSRGSTPVPTSSGKSTASGAVSPSKRAAQQQQPSQAQRGRPSHGAQSSGHHRMGSGHADVAKRAAGSRGGSPAQSRSPSPGPQSSHHAPRQSSPLAGETGSHDSYPPASSGAGIKRPASPIRDASIGFSMAGNVQSGSRVSSDIKRLRTDSTSSSPNSRVSSPSASGTNAVSPLEAELISLVRSQQVSTIGEVIARFRKRLQQKPEIKQEMMSAFKRVLTGGVKGETLRVKDGF